MNIQDDDDNFESFLKQFRPRAPLPLRIGERRAPNRRLLVALAALVIIAVVVPFSLRHSQDVVPQNGTRAANVEMLSNPEPLTIGKANVLLGHGTSFKAAVDGMRFKSDSKQITNGRHSALTVLGKEKKEL